MSSIKLNSSGGGSVSLAASSTSTDVTITFPSGNSSAGQALVAGNTSGTLDWETVPNSTAIPMFFSAGFSSTTASTDFVGTVGSAFSKAMPWTDTNPAAIDTHNAWDNTNGWYVVPQDGYYEVNMNFIVASPSYTTAGTKHYISSGIFRSNASIKTDWASFSGYHLKYHDREDGVTTNHSFYQNGILGCYAGDAIKTSFLWDKGTDTSNTTTSVALRNVSIGNPADRSGPGGTVTGNGLSIKYVRPL
jgi:hypothetical protein